MWSRASGVGAEWVKVPNMWVKRNGTLLGAVTGDWSWKGPAWPRGFPFENARSLRSQTCGPQALTCAAPLPSRALSGIVPVLAASSPGRVSCLHH